MVIQSFLLHLFKVGKAMPCSREKQKEQWRSRGQRADSHLFDPLQ